MAEGEGSILIVVITIELVYSGEERKKERKRLKLGNDCLSTALRTLLIRGRTQPMRR